MRAPGLKARLAYPAPPALPYVRVQVDYPPAQPSAMGDLKETLSDGSVRYAAGAALVYHGYRRTGSIFWALVYGLAGKQVPAIAVPVALAQGFGRRKTCP